MFLYTGYLNEGSSVLEAARSKVDELKEGMNPKNYHSTQSKIKWGGKKRESLVYQKWERLRKIL